MIDIKSIAMVRLALDVAEGRLSFANVTSVINKEDQFELLLMVAHGQEGTILEVAKNLLIENPNMEYFKGAAKALVEHILFSNPDDPYRLLGLTPMASLAEVKIRHQILIRLFHPDRQIGNQEKAEQFSSLINEAYEKIKRNDKGFKNSKLQTQNFMHSLIATDFDLRRQTPVLDRSRMAQKIFTPFNTIVLMLVVTVFILFVLFQIHKENLKAQAEGSYEKTKSQEIQSIDPQISHVNPENIEEPKVYDK